MTISEAIRDLADAWGCSPQEINTGDCDSFAEMIVNQGFGKNVWGGELYEKEWSPRARSIETWIKNGYAEGHYFTVYEGRYYDSECPEGVDWPDDLPFYQRVIQWITDPVPA